MSGCGPDEYFFTTTLLWCGKMLGDMALLHITYKRDRKTSNAITTISTGPSQATDPEDSQHHTGSSHTEEPPEALWQKLRCHINPNDYLLMLPLDPSWYSPKDQPLLSWLAAEP
jgi:hypothetical protein